MSEREERRNPDNEEIEIDLRELYYELKNNLRFIVMLTAAFVIAAAVYTFAIAKPVYQYTGIIRLPINQGGWQVNTCKELLKNDIGKGNSLSSVILLQNSYILQLVFNGNDASAVKENAEKYLDTAVKTVNKLLVGQQKANFEHEIVNMIRGDIAAIATKTSESAFTAADANERLKLLMDRVDEKVSSKIFTEAELVGDGTAEAVQVEPRAGRNLGLALVAGLFLSCGWVTAKYVWRLTYK